MVVVVGVVMVTLRPVKLSILPCLAVGLAGVGIIMVCFSAGWSIWDPLRPGLGLYLATLGGILLVPTGLASAMVAYILTSPALMERVRARTAARRGAPSQGAPGLPAAGQSAPALGAVDPGAAELAGVEGVAHD